MMNHLNTGGLEGTGQDTRRPSSVVSMLLNPDLWFEFVTINKFKNADDCEHHFDTGNVGPSRLIMFGDFVGGLLFLTMVVCSPRSAFGMNTMGPKSDIK